MQNRALPGFLSRKRGGFRGLGKASLLEESLFFSGMVEGLVEEAAGRIEAGFFSRSVRKRWA